ncbi:ferredoxin--NADP+ reductase [Sphingomonas guangdongensis]|uniref:ferredoxin--NADP(+) reductase n=1 Tax=Sphingomonas guangdongensis TaxID=1141890 RepID=A0A285QB54_9SPHN|nr:ferredoxin--NADP reductase [Sphingomonas guangdongensis]SOB78738.1 ferredoxin--NADP+ reductase [Sphingomonas guangdongensis]
MSTLPELAPATDRAPLVQPESAAFDTVKVLWVKHWNEHLFSLAVERPASMRFRSGEFVMLGLHDGNKPLVRAYSVASPSWADELEFLSIKVAEGPLTSRLQQVEAGDELYLGRKPTGTLVADALLGGKRLFLLSTGTGLAPFLSVARDPDIYSRFDTVVVAHSVRRVSDLAYHDEQVARWSEDPLVSEEAGAQFFYVPTVTREPFHTSGRIGALLENGQLFPDGLGGEKRLDPESDRVMLCGSTAMIRETAELLDGLGFTEGSNADPGTYVIERAFVG